MLAKEKQNQIQFDTYHQEGGVILGPYASHIWRHDPRHLCFLLSRYKFCAKMLYGKKSALEVGCGDSLGTPLILQSVEKIHCIDFESIVISDAVKRNAYGSRCTYAIHDMTTGPLERQYEASYSLDVIEHIPPEQEEKFIKNITDSLCPHGVLILGTPNIAAHAYASEGSRIGHVNLKSEETLRASLTPFFENVFIFSMNDEVVHTGYSPMAHYLIGMGVGKVRLS